MANPTINDHMFAVKPVLFCPSIALSQEDLFVQELIALQALSRLGLTALFSDTNPSSLLPGNIWSPGYWHVLNQCVESALVIFDKPPSTPQRLTDLVCQVGKVQAVLLKGLDELYEKLAEPDSQLWYNYLSVMLGSVSVLLAQKEYWVH